MRMWILLAGACAASAPPRPMRLSRVVLYQNGIGYFERAGHVGGDTLHLAFAPAELDDVLKTLTVIDRLGAAVATVDVPTAGEHDRAVELGVRLAGGRVHDVRVSYAVPTPTWKAAYRVMLDDAAESPTKDGQHALLQGWAMVSNQSQEDWRDVSLTLATGAAMSYALDLHTPEYVKRPDATGHLVAPPLLGPIDDEKAGATDSDGDGIPDVDDKCPDEPETFNGFEDVDGCPDRGRVVVTSSSIEVLDTIYFARGGDAIAQASQPILDAIAATLRGNPDLTKIEIGGHAGTDELDAWSVSTRRAAAVRAALISRGIEGERLVIVPYGATRPLDPAAQDKNRRVEFEIASRRDLERAAPKTTIDTARAAVRTTARPADVAGSVRYAVGEPVTIRRGAATLVSILNKPITAEDALLFRPDGNAPGSDRHPFRAMRIANDSGFTLEPGPIALFARGTFVGDGLISRLDLGETAWVPYALDGSTTVTVTTDSDERPVKIVSIQRGVITVEAAGVRVTRYTIAAGREPAKQIYVRHAKVAGYTAADLPPGTRDQGDAYLVPLPLQAGRTSVLAIEERQPRRRTIELLDQGATQLGLYVEGSHLPQALADQLRAAIDLRRQLGTLEDELDGMRGRVGDLSQRVTELRESLQALDKVRGADDLRKKLVASLAQATGDADALARAIGAKNEALAARRAKLQDLLREIELHEAASP